MKKRYDEVDQVVVPMETYKEPPARRPSENVFEFIELIDPERAERIKKRRDEAVRRANEVLRKHHDLGKPIEEISEDTVR
jgi:tRNA A37 N6-isopentenylltransferase MiaA